MRPGNEVDSPAKGCGRSVRLTRTENLTLKNNIFMLSGVVDETMLYQITGEGVKVVNFDHRENTFFNSGQRYRSAASRIQIGNQGSAKRSETGGREGNEL